MITTADRVLAGAGVRQAMCSCGWYYTEEIGKHRRHCRRCGREQFQHLKPNGDGYSTTWTSATGPTRSLPRLASKEMRREYAKQLKDEADAKKARQLGTLDDLL